jgi:adenylate cyclase
MATGKLLGELVPVGGGDPIPLTREVLVIGRRSTCDICLDYQNVSGQHCELAYRNGFWQIRDLGSTNGVKVNGERIGRSTKILRPGTEVSISSHRYLIRYDVANTALLDAVTEEEDLFSQSLMEKAGLVKPKSPKPGPRG